MNYTNALKKLTSNPKEWGDFYYNNYGTFKVQTFHFRPHPWIDYKPGEHKPAHHSYPNHREIFPDEIVIDIDGKRPHTTTHAYPVFNALKKAGVTCSLWDSGGDGYHIHLFIPELGNHSEEERKVLKEQFKKSMLVGLTNPRGLNSHVCKSKPKLIQAELAMHRKGRLKTLLAYYDAGANKIPKVVWKDYHVEKKRLIRERSLVSKLPVTNKNNKPTFVTFLEAQEGFGTVSDGRKRAAFIMASYYGLEDPVEESVKKKLMSWNEHSLAERLDQHLIQSTVKSVMRYHADGGIRMPYNYAKDLLEELGRRDIWEATITTGTTRDTRTKG